MRSIVGCCYLYPSMWMGVRACWSVWKPRYLVLRGMLLHIDVLLQVRGGRALCIIGLLAVQVPGSVVDSEAVFYLRVKAAGD